jgi:hypothetical protein
VFHDFKKINEPSEPDLILCALKKNLCIEVRKRRISRFICWLEDKEGHISGYRWFHKTEQPLETDISTESDVCHKLKKKTRHKQKQKLKKTTHFPNSVNEEGGVKLEVFR